MTQRRTREPGPEFRPHRQADGAARVAVVTGASSGIGEATAVALAALGWRVIALGRNPGRCAAAAAAIGAAARGARVDMITADLALMADAARASRDVAGLTDRVDLLINNAGGMAKERVITPEGLEQNFAGNHLGPFLLTNRLLPLLRRAASRAAPGSARIIITSSDASEMIESLPWDDLRAPADYSPGAIYCRGKLANVLFARGLAKRLAADGIVVHAVHPGTIDSNFIAHVDERTRAYMQTLQTTPARQAADDLVWLATADEPGRSTGGYFYGREPRRPNPVVDDDAAVDRLWSESEKLAGIA